MSRLIDVDELLGRTLDNPCHAPYITEMDIEKTNIVDAIPTQAVKDAITEIETDLSWFCFDDWGNMKPEWKSIKDIIREHTKVGDLN